MLPGDVIEVVAVADGPPAVAPLPEFETTKRDAADRRMACLCRQVWAGSAQTDRPVEGALWRIKLQHAPFKRPLKRQADMLEPPSTSH